MSGYENSQTEFINLQTESLLEKREKRQPNPIDTARMQKDAELVPDSPTLPPEPQSDKYTQAQTNPKEQSAGEPGINNNPTMVAPTAHLAGTLLKRRKVEFQPIYTGEGDTHTVSQNSEDLKKEQIKKRQERYVELQKSTTFSEFSEIPAQESGQEKRQNLATSIDTEAILKAQLEQSFESLEMAKKSIELGLDINSKTKNATLNLSILKFMGSTIETLTKKLEKLDSLSAERTGSLSVSADQQAPKIEAGHNSYRNDSKSATLKEEKAAEQGRKFSGTEDTLMGVMNYFKGVIKRSSEATHYDPSVISALKATQTAMALYFALPKNTQTASAKLNAGVQPQESITHDGGGRVRGRTF